MVLSDTRTGEHEDYIVHTPGSGGHMLPLGSIRLEVADIACTETEKMSRSYVVVTVSIPSLSYKARTSGAFRSCEVRRVPACGLPSIIINNNLCKFYALKR